MTKSSINILDFLIFRIIFDKEEVKRSILKFLCSKIKEPIKTPSIWMRWHSEWEIVVYKPRSPVRRWVKRGLYSIKWRFGLLFSYVYLHLHPCTTDIYPILTVDGPWSLSQSTVEIKTNAILSILVSCRNLDTTLSVTISTHPIIPCLKRATMTSRLIWILKSSNLLNKKKKNSNFTLIEVYKDTCNTCSVVMLLWYSKMHSKTLTILKCLKISTLPIGTRFALSRHPVSTQKSLSESNLERWKCRWTKKITQNSYFCHWSWLRFFKRPIIIFISRLVWWTKTSKERTNETPFWRRNSIHVSISLTTRIPKSLSSL